MKRNVLAATIFLSMSASVSAQTTSQLTIDQTADLLASGAAVVLTGTLQCEAGLTASLELGLRQVLRPRGINAAWGYQEITCTGNVQDWSETLNADYAAFRAGGAVAQGTLYVCSDEFGCTPLAEATTGVKLVRQR